MVVVWTMKERGSSCDPTLLRQRGDRKFHGAETRPSKPRLWEQRGTIDHRPGMKTEIDVSTNWLKSLRLMEAGYRLKSNLIDGDIRRSKHRHKKPQIDQGKTPKSIEIAENQTDHAGKGIIISRVRIRKTPTRNPQNPPMHTRNHRRRDQQEAQEEGEKRNNKKNRGEERRIVCFSPLFIG